MPDTEPDQEPLVLPQPVRLRVTALAAEALGAIDAEQLPAPLRRVAAFAPRRRAGLAGTQIALALEADPGFRERVAGQLRADRADVAAALLAGTPAPAADPDEVAALAYLLRPDNWRELVAASAAEAGRGDEQLQGATATGREDAARLRIQLDAALLEGRQARERAAAQVERLKEENVSLRRRVAEVRQRERAARTEADQAARRAEEVDSAGRAATADAQAEARRLRVRVTEAESALAAARREVRDDRDTGTVRARLLVDTVTEAVQGLRRELALPAVDVLPADTVRAAAPAGSRGGAGAGRALHADDPALLEQLLALPRVHLVIDGYNVTKTGYPVLALDRQRDRLLRDLAPVGARTGAEVTVVFDGADLRHPPAVAPPRGVRVLFSPAGETADDLVRRLVDAEPRGRPVVVVSTDRELSESVAAEGARTVSSAALLGVLARG